MDRKPNVALIYFPWKSRAPYNFINDIVLILSSISKSTLVIGGNTHYIKKINKNIKILDINIKMHDIVDIEQRSYSQLLWAFKAIMTQIFTGIALLRNSKNIDVVLFYLIYPYFIIPLIIAKILNKKTIEVITGNRTNEKGIISKILNYQDVILYNLIDGISMEKNSLMFNSRLNKYSTKLMPEGYRHIDVDKFHIITDMTKRNKVGYIGRLVKAKGVLNFIDAIQFIKKENITFVIGGDGALRNIVESKIKQIQNKGVKIEYVGWLTGEEYVGFLNDLKLFVLPTLTEGLPTTILEAMACGTIVLATSVGAIPDVIKNEETGFILNSSSPECIARNILKVLDHPDLPSIIKNSRELIEKQFTYKNAIDRYEKIIKVKI